LRNASRLSAMGRLPAARFLRSCPSKQRMMIFAQQVATGRS
jgi:hypothetical protein